METEEDTSITGSGPCRTVECFETGCDEEVDVAIWDDNLLAGKELPICIDCAEDTPEFSIWDASTIEEWGDEVPAPGEVTGHPIPKGKDWVVVDKHRNWEEKTKERFDGEIPDFASVPDELRLEIFLRNPEDSEALEAARTEARRRLEST